VSPPTGASVASGLGFLNGMVLEETEARSRKIDGDPGFFLAEIKDDAAFFALRRQGTIIAIRLSAQAYRQLTTAGMVRRPIPKGFLVTFLGDELWIPPDAFAAFNQLRIAGEIDFFPASWP
jgi:hypothetical protein